MRLHLERSCPYIAALFIIFLLTACHTAGGEEPSSEITTLIYASLDPGGVDRTAINEFNETHADVQIEVREYTEDSQGGRSGRELLLTEMIAGQVPDILDFGNCGNPESRLPYRQLAEKGYLEDLWPYIENDPELGREKVMKAPLKAAEVNGGLYMAFDSVTINTLVGAANVVGDRTSWSLAELRETYASMPEGSDIFQYCFSKHAVFPYMLSMSLDSYVDWESGECYFDSSEFRSALEFINSFPMDFNWNSTSVEEINREITQRTLEGRQMLSQEYVTRLEDFQINDAAWGGRAAFVGYPTEDGSVGSCFIPGNNRVAMTSTCRNKGAAWEVIRQMFLGRYTWSFALGKEGVREYEFPINCNDYELLKAVATDEDLAKRGNFIRDVPVLYDGPIITIQPLTEEDCLRFENFFNSIEKIDLYDDAIYSIVSETSGPYFAGDKTLDETVRLLNNRVGLYVNELR